MYWLRKVINLLDKVGKFTRWTNAVGITILLLTVVLTFVDVIMRYIFNRPIYGVLEVSEVMLIAAVWLAVAHTYNMKAHVRTDLITSKLKPKARTATDFITTLIVIGLFVIIIWQNWLHTLYFIRGHVYHSESLPILSWPFSAIIVLGCILTCLLLIRDLLIHIDKAIGLGLSRYYWLLMLGIPLLFLVLIILWVQPTLWQLSLPLVGMIGIIFSLLLLLSGMPIGFTLMLTALIFIGHIRGIQVGFNVIATDIYRTTGSYSWSVLTFFVLLGFFCLAGNFGKDLYFAAYRWLGRMPGGLAIATIGACTALAAIVGDGTSPVITMTSVALPEMRRYKYDDSLSAGSIMAGATLGPIIPPSVLFVIYGTLAQLSIGKLLVAGIFPGLLISGLFIITIYVLCLIKPKLGPAGEKSTWIQKLTALKAGAPVAVMFLVVIGGIYLGVFTPTEGGAMGVAAAIVIGFIERRFTMKSLLQAITNGGRTIAMSFCILIGALMFCRFIAWCNISGTATEFLKGLNMSPYAVAGLALFIFFLLGFVVDMLTLMLIGVPIMIPIAAAFGFNPIWWAVLMVLTINLGTITPPVAITLWVLKGTAPDIPMSNLYKGALYFVLPLVIAIVIIFFVPAISSWLPSLSFMK